MFSNIVRNLDIPQYQTKGIFHENLNTHSPFKLPLSTKNIQVSLLPGKYIMFSFFLH